MKIKLFAILILSISAVALVGYISFIGLSRLMHTLEETVQPDFREKDLQSLLYHLSESENSIRIFAITEENRYLTPYYQNLKEGQNILSELQNKSSKNVFLLHHLDTIDLFLKRKINIQDRIIRLKKDQKKINVYEEVLEKIESLERRNAFVDSLKSAVKKAEETLEKEIFQTETAIDSQQFVTAEERRGFFRKLFGSSKKDEEQKLAKEQQLENKMMELDTLIAAKDTLIKIIDTLQSEDISKELEETLAEIKGREEAINRELTIIEMDLTKQDNVQSNLIKRQVSIVEAYFDQLDVGEARKASSYFEKVTDQITLVGSIFSMLFLVLIIIVLHDINANQRYRKELELAKNRAEKLAQVKDDFMSSMSHEIRTPINAIIGFSEQLNHSPKINHKEKEQLKIIENASRHLLSIINEILDYAKIEAGKFKLEKIPFSIKENVQIVFDSLLNKAKAKLLEFELVIDPGVETLFVEGDPTRFRQIIFNLVDNAIKFTQEGFVKILVNYNNDILEIKVLDSGIGMDESESDRVFKKFEQVDSSDLRKYGGTGLGLTIVKSLVELQKGKIEVKSKKDLGSEFIVSLPLKIVEPPRLEALNDKSAPNFDFPKNYKVLIIDDEEYNRLLIQTILDKYNISYASFKSGKQAIENFQQVKFNIILLDLQMDDLDGFETTKILRKDHKTTVPIIAITATATGKIKSKCLDAGMNDVLIKPILEKDLLNCIWTIQQRQENDKSNKLPVNENEVENLHDLDDPFSKILNLFQNDIELTKKMTTIYHHNLESAISSLEDNLAQKSYERIQNTAHKIIPSSRHMGFNVYANKLKDLELKILENDENDDILENQTRSIIEDSREILKLINQFLKSPGLKQPNVK